jgi:hypothetical protein
VGFIRLAMSAEHGPINILVIGRFNSFTNAAFGGLVAGEANTISAEAASVSGGADNTASGEFASVSGGGANGIRPGNTASGKFASVSDGTSNTASGDYSIVLGGNGNTANATDSIVP